MKLFLECRMGASGDMIMAALYELLPDKKAFRERMERLGLPGVELEYSASTKCGITGTHISVKVSGNEEQSEDVHDHSHGAGAADHVHDHSGTGHSHGAGAANHVHDHSGTEHSHNHSHSADNEGRDHSADHIHNGGKRYGYNEILAIIRGINLPDNILEDALGVYKLIGEAEAAVHGVPLGEIHLHEVGALDAVADVIGCCLAMNMLGVTDVTASPVHVGSGSVRCEHGILPVPAPAAAEILKGVPIYGGSISGELCTPTGAALLKRFVRKFGDMPPMIISRIGCGMGSKDFEAANCIRAFLCEDDAKGGGNRDVVFEISCNLDDMTPEAVGAAFDVLLDNGALDVYAMPLTMKKNRPAVMLSCLCAENDREKLSRQMLLHTSTLGVRITQYDRSTLTRSIETIRTKYGDIRVKRANGFGVVKCKPEFDDVLAASKRHKAPYFEVYEAAMQAASGR